MSGSEPSGPLVSKSYALTFCKLKVVLTTCMNVRADLLPNHAYSSSRFVMLAFKV